MPPVCFFNFLFFFTHKRVTSTSCWYHYPTVQMLLIHSYAFITTCRFFWPTVWQKWCRKKTKQNNSQGATIQVCPLAVVQVFLVWTDKDWAVSRLKISLIRSDWSRLWKSPCGSWGVWNEEGQTSVRRHSPRSLNIFECLYILPVHPLNPPPHLHLLAQCDLTQSLNFIFMTFTPC